jgi:hypothetical protein
VNRGNQRESGWDEEKILMKNRKNSGVLAEYLKLCTTLLEKR